MKEDSDLCITCDEISLLEIFEPAVVAVGCRLGRDLRMICIPGRNWRHPLPEKRDFLRRRWRKTSRDLRDCRPLKEASMSDFVRLLIPSRGPTLKAMFFLMLLRDSVHYPVFAASVASVVQAGTKELTTKVRDGGYDY